MNIYISDLDGTLLNSSGQITIKDYQDIDSFYQKKIFFSIATARSIVTIKEIFDKVVKEANLKELKFHLPIIEYNGAYVTDYESKTILAVESIDKSILEHLFSECHKLDIAQIAAGNNTLENDFDKRYFCNVSEFNNAGLRDFQRDRAKANDKRITSAQDIFAEHNQVVGLTFIDSKEKLKKLIAFIETHYSKKLNHYLLQDQYNDPHWFWLLVQAKGATKANGIKKILKFKKIESGSDSYHLSVFGDNLNDREMFSLADKSLAPSNAVTEIKELADEIIPHHDKSPVIQYIKKKEKR